MTIEFARTEPWNSLSRVSGEWKTAGQRELKARRGRWCRQLERGAAAERSRGGAGGAGSRCKIKEGSCPFSTCLFCKLENSGVLLLKCDLDPPGNPSEIQNLRLALTAAESESLFS